MKYFLSFLILIVAAPCSSSAQVTSVNYNEIECLARNIYFEARNQSLRGKIAVGQVTMNRVRSSNYPNTVCGVVYQAEYKPSWKTGNPVPARNRCQFSWYCDGKPEKILDMKTWEHCFMLAELLIHGKLQEPIAHEATHYHADYSNPRWANYMQTTGKVGNHIFYKTFD